MSVAHSAASAIVQAEIGAPDYNKLEREPRQFQRVEHVPAHLHVGRALVAAAKSRASDNQNSIRLCLLDEVNAQPGIRASEKLAYHAISRAYRSDKGDAFIKQSTIADRMSRDVRTVKRAVRGLVELGLIVVVPGEYENKYKLVGVDGVVAATVVKRSRQIKSHERSDTVVTSLDDNDHERSDISVTNGVTFLAKRSDTSVTFPLSLPSSTAFSTSPLPSPLGETIVSGETTDRVIASLQERGSPEPAIADNRSRSSDDDAEKVARRSRLRQRREEVAPLDERELLAVRSGLDARHRYERSNVVPLRRSPIQSATTHAASSRRAAAAASTGYGTRQSTARAIRSEVEERLPLPAALHDEAREIAREFDLDPDEMIRSYRSLFGKPPTLAHFRVRCELEVEEPF